MKVHELIERINDNNFDLEKELEIKKHLPIEVKKTIAQGIIYECANEANGAVKIDSVQKYLSYTRYMIITHTNLEYTDEDYDMLCAATIHDQSLRDVIIRCFDDDATECEKILNYMVSDYLRENSLEVAVTGLVSNLNVKLAELAQTISEKLKDVDLGSMIPDNVDMNQLGDFLQNYIK